MKIKNTPNRKKYVPFAGAFIEVPVKAEWLTINRQGVVFSTETPPFIDEFGQARTQIGEAIELAPETMMVAHVEGHGTAQVIAIEDLMAGVA